MEWWGELVGILERRAGPVMHALTFVELNGINLAPLLRRFSSLTLLSTPTSLILETRLHKYSPEVQEGLLTLVLAQLRRLPAALVVDFVLAYADAQPSPMRREWPRRLVSRICQQLRALDANVSFPFRLRAILQSADEAEDDARYKVDVSVLDRDGEGQGDEGDEDEDEDEGEAEGAVVEEEVIEVLPEDEVVQEVEWDMDLDEHQSPERAQRERELKRKRKRDRAATNNINKRRKADDVSENEDDEEEKNGAAGGDDENEDDEVGVEVELDFQLSSDDEAGGGEEEEKNGDDNEEHTHERDPLEEEGEDYMDEPAAAAAAVTAEVAEQLAGLRRELETLGQEGKTDITDHSALDLLRQHPQLESVCQMLRPHELSDESAAFLCGQLFSAADISYKRCRTLVQYLLFPKVQGLERSVSRALSTAISTVAKQHPSPLTDALLLPLVLAPALGVPQSDVINRVLKECFDLNSVLQFFKAFLGSCESGEDESFSMSQSQSQSQDAGFGVTWTENTVVVLQAVVDMRGMVLPADAFELLLVQLDRHAAYFAASLKFSALMMSLITKHSNQVAHSKEYVGQIIGKSSTFMKKAALTKLAKLQI